MKPHQGVGVRARLRAAARWIVVLSCLTGVARAQRPGAAQFVEAQPLPTGRHMHGAAVLGDNLYVLGGAVEVTGWTKSVVRAPISPDGSLSAWTETTPLPANRHYIANGTIVLNDVVYVCGGKDGDTQRHVNTVLWTRPMADGNLEPWRETAPFTAEGASFVTTVSTPGYIHLMGGLLENSRVSNAVVSGRVSADGSVAEWEAGVPMPVPLWWHQAAAVGGRVWVWSGLPVGSYSPISDLIFSAPILSDGRIGLWRQESQTLPAPIFGGITATAGAFLFTFCPRVTEDDSISDIWFNAATNGMLGPWNRVTTELPNKVYLATAADYRRATVYVVGGKPYRGNVAPAPQVLFFRFASNVRAQETKLAAAAGVADPTQPPPSAPGQAADAGGPRPQYSYQAQERLSSGAVAGFLPFDQARRAAMGPPARPLIIYFHHRASRLCGEQLTQLQSNLGDFGALAGRASFAWVDVEESPQIAQQMGVWRAPTWMMFDSRGNPMGQNIGLLPYDRLEQAVARVAP